MSWAPGAHVERDGTRFALWSAGARSVRLCLFDGETELPPIPLERGSDDIHRVFVPGVGSGARYGYRVDGDHDPAQGLWFDPAKLLLDPLAIAIDRAYTHDQRLSLHGFDTAPLVPKGVVTALPPPPSRTPPCFDRAGLIYELQVRGFTKLHPDIPPDQRGTIAALGHPAVIAHLTRIGVSAVELMPVTAWIDERHLPPLGLSNAWGYNPVSWIALDPRLAPGGIAELRGVVETLHAAGIGVILDVVFNHMGESDSHGPTLSLRGIDNRAYYAHDADWRLINDTGTGNTIACNSPPARELILAAMRHFVMHAGIDGFRFDLAPIMGRSGGDFDPASPLLQAILADPVMSDRILIAEPWDIGPGGYQLGRFPAAFDEWNDRWRDDVRRFWRGDAHSMGALATRLAGSSDSFSGPATRSVNFLAAHDGFALADLVAYEHKHNHANGEANRDGHDANHSWNNGVEGPSNDPAVIDARAADLRALLGTLFASRGMIMLTAGDEFGRTQRGNNNAYAQDNAITWLDWDNRDHALEAHVAMLADLRRRWPALADPAFLTGAIDGSGLPDVAWLAPSGDLFTTAEWDAPDSGAIAMVLRGEDGLRLAVLINRTRAPLTFALPPREGFAWGETGVEARAVRFVEEQRQR